MSIAENLSSFESLWSMIERTWQAVIRESHIEQSFSANIAVSDKMSDEHFQ